jgi:hypothetical protein
VICPIIEHSAPTNKDRFGGGRLAHPAPVEIDEVWMMDDLYHNESVTLSAGRLGPVQSWEDTGRDLLNVAEHVLPAIPVGVDAPWDLPWTAEGTPRKLIGVGHSFGGAATAHAAHARPDLFSAIFLVDPVTIPHVVLREPGYADPIKWYGPTTVVLRRRDVWPSRKAAREILRPSSFFARIAAPQFEVYLNRALVPVNPADPDGPVTLATPIWAEACVFTETDAGPRSYDKLAHLPMPVGWVMAGNSATTRGDESTQEMVARPPRAINERHLAAGHLVSYTVYTVSESCKS